MTGILTRRGGDYNEILAAAGRNVQIACSSDMENKCAKLTNFSVSELVKTTRACI
jgi:hypothetical protein